MRNRDIGSVLSLSKDSPIPQSPYEKWRVVRGNIDLFFKEVDMIHQGRVLEEGKWCENAIIVLLTRYGAEVVPSTLYEDHRLKVDLWVRRSRREEFLPIQFTTNREAVVSEKGLDALRRGIIPSWIDPRAIEDAVAAKDGHIVVSQFWRQVDAVLAGFRDLRPIRRMVAA